MRKRRTLRHPEGSLEPSGRPRPVSPLLLGAPGLYPESPGFSAARQGILDLDERTLFASIAPPAKQDLDPALFAWRRGRAAEGTRLLNEHTPKGYRGFESLRLRHFV